MNTISVSYTFYILFNSFLRINNFRFRTQLKCHSYLLLGAVNCVSVHNHSPFILFRSLRIHKISH